MRPVRLTLRAFGPYPKSVEIDFRKATAARLFGIYGQTGSGKSTIFSGMTFALFGEAAKSEQEIRSLRSDHADTGDLTEVEFIFDVGGKRYVVRRQPDQWRPKVRGEGETESGHEAFLFDATGLSLEAIAQGQCGRIIAERKVSLVDQAIVNILGYGAKQFRQIVLLPQGRFEKFLAANTRDRVDILRELFDVSAFRALMEHLKERASAAESQVRADRDACARQLNDEGFADKDALTAGIAETMDQETASLATEAEARALLDAANLAFNEAEQRHQKFVVAAERRAALAVLEQDAEDNRRRVERVDRAERARRLIDPETRVRDVEKEVVAGEAALASALSQSGQAAAALQDAEIIFDREKQRSDEEEQLRQKRDNYQRFVEIVAQSRESEQAVLAARAEMEQAQQAFDKATQQRQDQQQVRLAKVEALSAARKREDERKTRQVSLAALAQQHTAAQAHEGTVLNRDKAERQYREQEDRCENLQADADSARAALDEAERQVLQSQALHLATALEPGAPCPVCGSLDHPRPATGEAGQPGLGQARREAKDRWERSDKALRDGQAALSAARATLEERARALADLDVPDTSAAALSDELVQEKAALQRLGPAIDIGAAETDLDALETYISRLTEALGPLQEKCRLAAENKVRAETAHEGLLHDVPDALRNAVTVSRALEEVKSALAALIEARKAAEDNARKARERVIGAAKDVENAEANLEAKRTELRSALAVFQGRLDEEGLTVEAFRQAKPALQTLEADKAAIKRFTDAYTIAASQAAEAQKAIEGLQQPDLAPFRERRSEAEQASVESMKARIRAGERSSYLRRLRDRIEAALLRIDAAERDTGALRALASLVNGKNSQNLNLETYAIGAMFDAVLGSANARLGPMTASRYRLERDMEGTGRSQRGLGIQVFDAYTGKARSTGTLSGGETFIAALALALGLADVVESSGGKVRLDTIFIDEGFGSLDAGDTSGTLDVVLGVLQSLVSMNRVVGVISHVREVQEAIPNGFYVRKGLSGSSVEEREAAP